MEFKASQNTLMADYYQMLDEKETKRVPDIIKMQIEEMKALSDKGIEEAKERVLGWGAGKGKNVADLKE